MRIVATLTTLPDRYHLLVNTIESLINQDTPLDAIYIGLPKRTRRKNEIYPELPAAILKHEKVKVVRLEIDHGPISKLLGALISEQDPDTFILSTDDDAIYAPNLLSTYMSYVDRFPNDVICGSGTIFRNSLYTFNFSFNQRDVFMRAVNCDVPPEGRKVDILQGVGAVLYRRKFFPKPSDLYAELLHYGDDNIDVFLNDDILLSAYMHAHNINIRIVRRYPDGQGQRNKGDKLSGNAFTLIPSMNRCIDYLKEHGYFLTTEPMNMEDSMVFSIILKVIAVAILVIMAIYFYVQI